MLRGLEDRGGTTRGRPRKGDARRHVMRIRMNDEELAVLDQLCKSTGMDVGKVLRTAMLYFNLIRSEK